MMRQLIFAIAMSFCLVGGASAAVFYEPFNYNPGNLRGNINSGSNTTWYSSATSGTDDQVQVINGSMSYSGLPASVGNSTSYGGDGRTDRIAFPSSYNSANSTTVYYSLLLKVTDLTGTLAAGATIAGFNNTPQTAANDGTAGQPTTISGRLLIKAIDANTFQIGASKGSGNTGEFAFSPIGSPYNINDTIYVVGRYTYNTGTTTDDSFAIFVNPPSASLGDDSQIPSTPTANGTAGTDGGTIATFILRQNTGIVPAGIQIDELRVDTSWARVTSNLVPEPASFAVLGIVAVQLIARRRR